MRTTGYISQMLIRDRVLTFLELLFPAMVVSSRPQSTLSGLTILWFYLYANPSKREACFSPEHLLSPFRKSQAPLRHAVAQLLPGVRAWAEVMAEGAGQN